MRPPVLIIAAIFSAALPSADLVRILAGRTQETVALARIGTVIEGRFLIVQQLENRRYGHGGPIEDGGNTSALGESPGGISDAMLQLGSLGPLSKWEIRELKKKRLAAAHQNALTSKRTARRFDLGKKLGAGAYATAYLATDSKTNSQVVLKILTYPDDFGDQTQTWDECEVMSKLQRESRKDSVGASRLLGCIENLIQKGVTGVEQKIVLEFGGVPLSDSKELYKLEAVQQMLEGVKYLAKMHISHRDLKVENVLVSGSRNPVIKIIDFGLVADTQEKLSCQGSRCQGPCSREGKCSHGPDPSESCNFGWQINAPPEMRNKKQMVCLPSSYPADAFDVYSVGVMLVNLACGGEYGKVLIGNIQRGHSAGWGKCKDTVDEGLQRFAESALQANYHNRGSASALLDAL